MPNWRCPSCGTPQAEASRCWVCARSSTTCSSCLHFRRGIAGGLGTCGRFPKAPPLHGDELRSCWESRAMPAADGLFGVLVTPPEAPLPEA